MATSATKTWYSVSGSGSGNATITVTTTAANTGRSSRYEDFTVTGTGVTNPATVRVTQAGIAEYVNFSGTSTSWAKGGGTVTVTGKSNTSKLTFAWVTISGQTAQYTYDSVDPTKTSTVNTVDYPEISLSTSISINGGTAQTGTGTSDTNGVVSQVVLSPSGDPGNTGEYTFSFSLTVPANTTIEEIYRDLKVTCNDTTKTAQIKFTQAAGDPTLSVSPTTINVAATSGATGSTTVTSNTTWTIS